MAYQNTDIGGRANTQYKQYIADSSAELENIPKEFCSMVFCLDDSSMYICNSDKEWKLIS